MFIDTAKERRLTSLFWCDEDVTHELKARHACQKARTFFFFEDH